MFKLRQAHCDRFQEKAERDFVNSVTEVLRLNYGETTVGFQLGEDKVKNLAVATLNRMVFVGLAKSKAYGIIWSAAAKQFILMMFLIAPNFDRHPECQSILTSPILFPNWKLDVLVERKENDSEFWDDLRTQSQYSLWNF